MSLCHHHVTNRPLTILGFLAAMLVVSSPARAATIFVDSANCPGPGDGSMGNPFCSIQDGIDRKSVG